MSAGLDGVLVGQPALDRLLDLLDLERIEEDIFRGNSPAEPHQRVFGGGAGRPGAPRGPGLSTGRPPTATGSAPPPPGERREAATAEPRNLVWIRADGKLPDDPLVQVCALTFASDMTLLDSALVAHGK